MTVALKTIELATADPAEIRRVVQRSALPDQAVRVAASDICQRVQTHGDEALIDAGLNYGGGRDPIRVGHDEMESAWDSSPDEIKRAITAAAGHIRTFHSAQRPSEFVHEPVTGVRVERRWAPLARVGVYVPGGKAAYPSSLLMGAIPARVAGVREIVIASPADPDGAIDKALLAAAHHAGVDEMYAMGGAQAIAALAYGTETVARVEKIVGPGNAWVTAAKLAVLGECAIDMPAGPSEVLVIADSSADPEVVAVDLLCQAEHGPDSPAILVTTDASVGGAVVAQLNRILPTLERSQILGQALADHGLVVIARTMDECVAFANDYAAEHVSVATESADAVAERITAAGSIYVGHWSPEAAGDYATGANHVLPTGGLARSMNPLSYEDFGSWRQVQTMTEAGLRALAPTICDLATAEGLTAHRLSAEIRLKPE